MFLYKLRQVFTIHGKAEECNLLCKANFSPQGARNRDSRNLLENSNFTWWVSRNVSAANDALASLKNETSRGCINSYEGFDDKAVVPDVSCLLFHSVSLSSFLSLHYKAMVY